MLRRIGASLTAPASGGWKFSGGLKLWLAESANVVIRLKKMDEDGRTANYPTKQAQDYDAQRDRCPAYLFRRFG